MALSLLSELIEALRCLPGVGPRSAQRMAFHILERNRDGGRNLARLLNEATDKIGKCARCQTFSEKEFCQICSNSRRDQTLLCVVETPADIMALEQTQSYQGNYFVLHGRISPLDGLGPNEIGVPLFLENIRKQPEIKELILATNPTVEGDATAHYLASLIAPGTIKCTRIAYGVPMGGELEYLDGNTLARAFAGRVEI